MRAELLKASLFAWGGPCVSAGRLSGIQLAAAATETFIDSLYHYDILIIPCITARSCEISPEALKT